MEDKLKKILTVFVFSSLSVLFAASSFAQPAQRMMRKNRSFDRAPNRILHFLKANQEELGITDSQMEQTQNLVFSHEEKMLKMRNDLDMQHLELQKLMQDRDNLDYEKIRGALSTTSEARTEMFIERLKQRDEINKILTPEQRDALKAMVKDDFRRGFRPMMERMRDREQWSQRFPRIKRRSIR
jgi:Spy/CpxP family protein refolding chaperone